MEQKIDGLIGILGAGESGIGAALLASKKYSEVLVSDNGVINSPYIEELEAAHIPFEEEGHSFEILKNAKLIIKSPGIPDRVDIVQRLMAEGIEVISEIEFGSRYYEGVTIAITGSNGKTTTAGLTGHLIAQANKDVAIGGNYGESFCRILSDRSPEIMVLEISSFQLDNISGFKPNVALLLNITPDHLDRYGYEFENYIQAKLRIIENQSEQDLLIFNNEDQVLREALDKKEIKQNRLAVKPQDFENGLRSKDGNQIFELTLQGRHNLFNAYCAVAAARAINVSEDAIAAGLASFKNAAHRLETVAIIDGVTYINDSKATNVDASYYGLAAMKGSVVWIAGGVDKGNDYSQLFPIIDRVKALICLGKDNQKLKLEFKDKIEIIKETEDVDKCVHMAKLLAQNGDMVLLSPACASFDLFKNYIDRGLQFGAAVKKLE